MKHITLNGVVRTAEGKAAVKAIRRQGLVPCNLYGNGIENVLFTISDKDLKTITHTPASYIIDLKLDTGAEYTCIFHQAQYHPVTDEALHVDFLNVVADKPIAINVPVSVVGHAEGVKLGGKLLVSARKLKVCAMMENLPDIIEVDCSHLRIGKQIVAGELSYPNMTIVSPKATIICAVLATRASAQAGNK